MNKRLQFYIKLFYSLTFNIEKEFSFIYSYEERLNYFKNTYQVKVKELRKKFALEYVKDRELKKAYHKYMKENFDYILFVNLNVSAPDQRKFDGGGFIPFTAYWYQFVIWELHNHFTLAYWKSRDIGLSFAINSGHAMGLALDKGDEVLYVSRVQDDVDKTHDLTNSNMGRTRAIIMNSLIHSLKDFYKNVFLRLYSTAKSGIIGSSSNANPGRSKRFKLAFMDEAGAIKILMQMAQSISMSAKHVTYAGTLLVGSDTGFRQIIEEGITINPREFFEDFKSFLDVDNGVYYKEARDKAIAKLREKIPKGKSISFTNTYADHPLKAGNCDYYKIECNRLLNDPVIIAHELDADLNAGSPDRSFYSATDKHLEKITLDDFSDIEILMGFDPGSHGTAAMTPVIIDNYGFYYILESEMFDRGTMKEWLDKLKRKYGNFTVFAEQSVKGYSKAGSGWMSYLRSRNLKTVIVSNRNMGDQLLVVNELFREKRFNELGQQENMIKVSDKNKWWLLSYIHGEKYTDSGQKKMSHPAESMIAVLFHLNKELIDGINYGVSTA